jgi:hypothetical protein
MAYRMRIRLWGPGGQGESIQAIIDRAHQAVGPMMQSFGGVEWAEIYVPDWEQRLRGIPMKHEDPPTALLTKMQALPDSFHATVLLRGSDGDWMLHSGFTRHTDALLMRDQLDGEGWGTRNVRMYQRAYHGQPFHYRERRTE